MSTHVEIPLVSGGFTLVSPEDADLVRAHRWYGYRKSVDKTTYARASVYRRPAVFIHRLILGLRPGERADHINGDGLDNRRENLRRCTASQNLAAAFHKPGRPSRSAYRGISWIQKTERWRAAIKCQGTRYTLGYFRSEEEAARIYDEAALLLFGEFARPNFPKAALTGHATGEK